MIIADKAFQFARSRRQFFLLLSIHYFLLSTTGRAGETEISLRRAAAALRRAAKAEGQKKKLEIGEYPYTEQPAGASREILFPFSVKDPGAYEPDLEQGDQGNGHEALCDNIGGGQQGGNDKNGDNDTAAF